MGLTFLNGKLSRSSSALSETPSDGAMIQLLEAKISQLESQLEKKNSVIQDLQRSCMDKLDLSCTTSSHTEDTSSDSTGSSGSGSLRDHEHPLVEKLTAQLEDRNAQIATLQNQLHEKTLLTTHLQERLTVAEQGKNTLVAHVASLEKKIFDQANQIECLQDLNETNSSIVSEMELTQQFHAKHTHSGSRRNSSGSNSSSPGTPNQWKMYQKLQSLMDANNKLAHQLARVAVQKQDALKKVAKLEKEQLNLCDQVDALKEQLNDQKHRLQQMQLETQCDFSMDPQPNNAPSVLPELQQCIDIFNNSSQCLDTEAAENTNNDDPKLLHLSLQNCQAQLKQMQRNHELQLQKTVRQSVLLAETKATVDTLTAKVEHYETLMDEIIARSLSLRKNNRPSTSSNNHKSNSSPATSKAARQLMADDNLGPSLQLASAPPNVYSARTTNTFALPIFMPRHPKPRPTVIRQESEYIDFEDYDADDAASVDCHC